MKNILPLLAIFTLISPSHALDVFGTDNRYIKVTEGSSGTTVKFELCSLIDHRCEQIGNGFYDKKDLMELQASEEWDWLKVAILDAGIVVGSAVTGGGVFYAIVGSSSMVGAGTSIFGTAIAAVAGGTGGGAVAMSIDTINPYEQYKQIETLDAPVLNDEKVMIDYDVQTFAKRLSAVLDNLE